MSVKATSKLTLKITERWAAPANGRAPVFIHEVDNPKLEGTLNESSTPPVSKPISGALTLTAGAAVIDLTAGAHPSGTTIDLTGKRVQRVVFRARATITQPVTISMDGTNGYDLKLTETLAAGDAVAKSFSNNLALVAANTKRIAFASNQSNAIVDFVIVAG